MHLITPWVACVKVYRDVPPLSLKYRAPRTPISILGTLEQLKAHTLLSLHAVRGKKVKRTNCVSTILLRSVEEQTLG